jgi:hypothetical protein
VVKKSIIYFKKKSNMKKISCLIIFLLVNIVGYSQGVTIGSNWLQDTNGKPITTNNYVEMEGSPYFPSEWISGSVQIKGDSVSYKALRYNTISGMLEFLLNEKPYEVINPMNEFTLGLMLFRKGFQPVEEQNVNSFYQVLYDGKQKLLCFRVGSIYTESTYNSATKTKKITIDEKYYVQKTDGKLYPVKKNLKNILALMDGKTEEVNNYCQKENIKIKSWSDVGRVLEFADGLGK